MDASDRAVDSHSTNLEHHGPMLEQSDNITVIEFECRMIWD
jgi:hypothetical protein